MTLTLEQIEKVRRIQKERGLRTLDEEKAGEITQTLVEEVTGRRYELDELVSALALQEHVNLVQSYDEDLYFSKYADAFFYLWQTRLSEQRLEDLIAQGKLYGGDDLESLQRNVAKFLARDEALAMYYGNLEFPNELSDPWIDLNLILERLYKFISRPEDEKEKIELILSIPTNYFGLDERAKPHLEAMLMDLLDYDWFRAYKDFFTEFEKVRQKSEDYFNVIGLLKSVSRVKQEKLFELGNLPLSVTFHDEELYALVLEDKQPRIIVYDMKGSRIREKDMVKIGYPMSLAAYQNHLIFVNKGKIFLLDTDLKEEPLQESVESEQHIFGTSILAEGSRMDSPQFSLVRAAKASLAKFEGHPDDWKLRSVQIHKDNIAGLLYNSNIGQYVIALRKADSLIFADGTSSIFSEYLIDPNIGYHPDGIWASMTKGGTSYPPSFALLDKGIVVTEGDSIRVLDYGLQEVAHQKLGEGEFEILDSALPFSAVAGGGEFFGFYANFRKLDEKHRVTPPIFLFFSMNDALNLSFLGPLDAEAIPLNIATGMDISDDGYLAISSSGGRVYGDYKVHTPGSLELFKLEKLALLGTKTPPMLE